MGAQLTTDKLSPVILVMQLIAYTSLKISAWWTLFGGTGGQTLECGAAAPASPFRTAPAILTSYILLIVVLHHCAMASRLCIMRKTELRALVRRVSSANYVNCWPRDCTSTNCVLVFFTHMQTNFHFQIKAANYAKWKKTLSILCPDVFQCYRVWRLTTERMD